MIVLVNDYTLKEFVELEDQYGKRAIQICFLCAIYARDLIGDCETNSLTGAPDSANANANANAPAVRVRAAARNRAAARDRASVKVRVRVPSH